MADAFRVDPKALADAVLRMAEFQRTAESMLTEIDSLVSNLHATWSGEAAAAHAEAHERWARGEAMMRAALARLQAAGATAHGSYVGAMSMNLAMWS
ncbi:WXG100 family type VII secretion target [Mycobacterium sp. Aquia_216]|uniref:WXG100 family type VII secretion target n=1 Tax=Mycobacterium sp. Aquia_216 TaxID=2991729 RepID=UPI00227C2594|nr:WXG100 family type VII secretion target [Mycobacterium sp. Aquia_216]WAJ45972.1 WXG100 family type VII secretion target [Mycobacterium sp. Aquia_216]